MVVHGAFGAAGQLVLYSTLFGVCDCVSTDKELKSCLCVQADCQCQLSITSLRVSGLASLFRA